jgi:hypothetical protein
MQEDMMLSQRVKLDLDMSSEKCPGDSKWRSSTVRLQPENHIQFKTSWLKIDLEIVNTYYMVINSENIDTSLSCIIM